MTPRQPDPLYHLRLLFLMGRVSNLPTVWSNCLAAWLLSGGGDTARLQLVCLGATFLYLGGMYLNDAFDAAFDAQFRRERPIPAGLIRLGTVWQLGVLWLGLGLLTLAWLGKATGVLAVLLIVTVVVYDAVHKAITLAPVLMALCRFLLYLIAGTSASNGLSGLTVWSGVALALYILGLSYIARHESTRPSLRWWPTGFLAAPVVLALVVNGEGYYQQAGWLILLLVFLIIQCLHSRAGETSPDLKRTVSGLLAGIIWVDLLAVAGGTTTIAMLFVALFLLARLLQRVIPAT